MLLAITDPADPMLEIVAGDPVRPSIPQHKRAGRNSAVLVLMDEQDEPESVVCVNLLDSIPSEEDHLFGYQGDQPDVAVLYTIWSLKTGAGTRMINVARNWIRANVPTVNRLVTLSPPTPMARRFHLRNGAVELRVNPQTVNFEYAL